MNKILIPKEGNSTFTMIYAKTGSRCEPESIKGVSHFLEHLMFKGTKEKTAKQIAYSIEKYGVQLNAWTDYELTAYWIKSANKYKKDAEAILMDMLHNSQFPQKEIDKERNIIIQEMKMYQDNPRALVRELFYNSLFAKEDGLHTNIIGTRKSLDNIDRQVMLDYYNSNYKNLTLVQVGDVGKQIKSEEDWPEWDTKSARLPLKQMLKTTIRKSGITQANVIIGGIVYPDATSRLDKNFNFDILEGVLNDMSGRLFSKVREEHNLCYGVSFWAEALSCGTYVWSVSIALEESKIDLAYKLIMEELTRPITKKELTYSKTKMIGKKALTYDNISTVASTIAYSDVLGMDYLKRLFNYETKLNEVHNINKFVKSLNFKNNIMVQVLPE